jgi:tight adherence protein C
MILLLILALVLVALAVAAGVSVATTPQIRRIENLGQIGAYGYQGLTVTEPTGRALRADVDSIAEAIGDLVARLFPRVNEEKLQTRLLQAGVFKLGPRRFLGYRALLILVAPIATAILLSLAGANPGLVVIAVLAGVGGGFAIPGVVLDRRARARLAQIDHDLPELVDLLVVTLEAGAGFGAALKVASDRISGPLGDELRLTIQEHTLGLSMFAALESWLGRCDTPAVRSFVRAIAQGDRLGVSIGQILRNLAIEMRRRQRQLVEEQAQKSPVKILFPLVFLIFPAMFLIMLGPTLLRIGHLFGS